jgi:serine/threonine-protein kinase RsbT
MSVTEAAQHHEYEIDCEDDVVLVRRAARTLAQERGFDAFATAAITTAASELARNVLIHAGRGRASVDWVEKGDHAGISLEFRDEGPGINDLDRALAGGFSTAKSLGLGLSGSKRLVDEFSIETSSTTGTVVRVVKWARFSSKSG